MIRRARVVRVDPAGGVWLTFPSGVAEGPYPTVALVEAGGQVVVAELDPPSGFHVVLGQYHAPVVGTPGGGGPGGGMLVIDNGDGTWTTAPTSGDGGVTLVDNGDGTWTTVDAVDNGDGTWTMTGGSP